ncbi:GIY-YIG nuclease family protein [Isachenkonia alkalipeptolytica]|uniref:Excinuclease cho n=1 Tax=Isachenkonia alkalipeptolytica TaxID=2565777 RepID=A0AA44BDF8_9CLOT|nr:GIY-YIG nuclease family protein [Isachenkonia alkalipeptolytica]NBG87868.1 hypothetical protein [Isachenkonia alkalipeptolytica]
MKTILYNSNDRKNLPRSPGVYRFIDQQGEVLYIGKSVNLKSRVNSYFQNKGEGEGPEKLLRMQGFITFIEVTPTPTELEAEWLEQALIERHHPQYNQQMKSNARHGYLVPEAGKVNWRWREIPLGKDQDPLQEKRKDHFLIGPFRNPKALKDRLKVLYNFTWLEDWSYQPLPVAYPTEGVTKIVRWLKEIFGNQENYNQWIRNLEQERDLAAKKLEFEKAGRFQEVIASVAPLGHALKRNQLLYQGDPPFMIDRKNQHHCGYYLKNGVLFRTCWISKPKASGGEGKVFLRLIGNREDTIEGDGTYQQWRLTNLDQEMILYRAFVKQEEKIIGCFL